MDITTRPLKKYSTLKFSPKKISNLDYLFSGQFVYLIYEKTNHGHPLSQAIQIYLEKKFINIVFNKDHFDHYLAILLPDTQDNKHIIHQYQSQKHIYYMGHFFVSDASLSNPRSILIFQKSHHIPRILYDPPIVIKQIKHQNINLNVICDHLIIGGTKTRAIVDYLQELLHANNTINTLIYLGASNGYAQVAFAYSLSLLKSNIKLKIYFQDTKLVEAKKLKSIAKYIYPNTEYVILKKPFREIWPLIDDDLAKNKNAYLIPFGLNDPTYKKYFYQSLKNHLLGLQHTIKELWIVGGSGTLFTTLYDILPNTHFNVVQVGKTIHTDLPRVTLYKSSYPLYTPIPIHIPYPTLHSYDGKIWEFASKFTGGIHIWNVGGVHEIV